MTEALAERQTDDYRIKLPVFSGPLDLLLHLIRNEEVDIYEIPLARITSQYLKYLEMMKNLDLEVAGEFILMAATLIRIKTRLLLPRDETDSEEPDPREELIMALVEYKKYKEAGEILKQRAFIEELVYVPPSPIEKIKCPVELTPATSLYDLITAFREVMVAAGREAVHSVAPEEISVEDRIEIVLSFLKQREYASFSDLFADIPTRLVAVVTFIAILELARTRRIHLYQALPFSEIRVYPGGEPVKSFDEQNSDRDQSRTCNQESSQ